MDTDPIVSILCATYNQAAYIKDALDSFFMQKTDFPFEVIVHDDASTDGTVDILREYEKQYPNLKVLYEEFNQFDSLPDGGYFQGLMVPLVRGKYVATCDGDDYWIDVNKLQRQYDYMESHSECICCGHKAKIIESETGLGAGIIGVDDAPCSITTEMALLDEKPQTSTLFYRHGIENRFANEWSGSKVVGDTQWLVWLCENGDVYYDSCLSSVYRGHAKGSFSSEKDKDVWVERMRLFMEHSDDLDDFTNHKYKSQIEERKTRQAYVGALYTGLGFLSKGAPGYRYRHKIKFRQWIYLILKDLRRPFDGFKKNARQ